MRESQLRSQRELAEQRQALVAREEALRSMEARLNAQNGGDDVTNGNHA